MGRLVRGVLVGLGALVLVATAVTASAASPASTAGPAAMVLAVPGSGTLSSGDRHTCGIRTDGTLVCWGDPASGPVSPPAGTFTQVSTGFSHACAVKTDETLACWGDDSTGQVRLMPTGTFSQVSSGDGYSCAVRTDQTVICWGDNSLKQASPPGGTFSQVSSGGFHSCGIRTTDGSLACWGYNRYGQAPLIPPSGIFRQVSSSPASDFLLVVGDSHTCGVRADETLICWGNDSTNQISGTPAGTFSQVSAGGSHNCGVRTDGTVACWGYNFFGQAPPIPPPGTFRQVSSGGLHTCGVQTDGTPVCWGDNTYGQSFPPATGFAPAADTTPPVMTLPANITAEPTGPSGAVVTYAVSAVDPDDAAAVSCTPASGSTFPLGVTTVACTATDTHGNAANASFTVTVIDTTPPVVTINVPPSLVEATGPTGAVVTFTATATDAVSGSPTPICVPASGTTFAVGSTTITCSATDVAGNKGTATATVVVEDKTAPTLSLPANITAEATGPEGAVVTYAVSAADPDDAATVACTPVSGAIFPIGLTTVTCTATDTNKNAASGTFTVTVADTTPPVVTISVTSPVEATGPSGAAVTFTASATDAVSGSLTPICVPASGTAFALGSTPITCSATDGAHNKGTATATVLVEDKTAPSLSLPANITAVATGPSGAVVTYAVSATDPDDATTVACIPPSGSTFHLGLTTVACTATDTHGNTANGTFTVTVIDTTPPVMTLPANITAEATGPSGAAVTYAVSATDPDDAATVACTPISGTTFPIGLTPVTCTATDTNSNTASGTFTVKVVDTTPPVVTITAPSLVEATGPSGAAVTYAATATDAVSGSLTPTCAPSSGSTFPLGTTTITCTATDTATNTGSASAAVVVEDKTAPTLSLPVNITAVATSASGALVTYAVSATDPDNDTSTLTISCSPLSGSTFPAGVTTVTCTATDHPAGNTSTGSFQVAVVDFSMGPISPVTVPVGGAASTSVAVNSVSGFSSAVALSASGAPVGVSVTFNPSSVTPTSGGSASSILTVHLSPMVTPTTFTLTVTGTFEGVSHTSPASVTVTVGSPAIADVIGQLLLAGCIDNAGIANALTAKLTAEQGAIGGGNTKTAINILSAFTDQVRAQTGKHMTADCATVLMTDARSLIDSLAVSATPNPITGSVHTASGSGVAGAILTLKDSAGTTVATATTDITGFYFFATTGLLTPGASYTVTVTVPIGSTAASAASQTFTWPGGAEVSLADFTTT